MCVSVHIYGKIESSLRVSATPELTLAKILKDNLRRVGFQKLELTNDLKRLELRVKELEHQLDTFDKREEAKREEAKQEILELHADVAGIADMVVLAVILELIPYRRAGQSLIKEACRNHKK